MLSLTGIQKKDYIDDLEKVQHRATKLPENISHLSYPHHLAALNLPILAYCRMRAVMMKTLKILNNIYDSRVANFILESNFSPTKGRNLNLFVQHANFNARKLFFSIHIADIRNRLPSSVVNAPSVVCFKKRFDKCWADLKIKFDNNAPFNYSKFNYTKINTPQNIDFNGELSVETNAI